VPMRGVINMTKLSFIKAIPNRDGRTFSISGTYGITGKKCASCGEIPTKEFSFGVNMDFFIDNPIETFTSGLRELADSIDRNVKSATEDKPCNQ